MKLKNLFRFRLGTLLLFVTAACIWFGTHVRHATRQSQFLRAVDDVSGEVRFKHQVSTNPDGVFMVDPSKQPAFPVWMRSTVGDEYFQEVDQVNLIGTEADDKWLANLESVPSVRLLMLRDTGVTGAGLSALRDLKRLEVLDIQQRANLTPENLAFLSGLKNLTTLDMTGSVDVSDDGFAVIASLTNLKTLAATDSQVTDEGLGHLERMTRMTHLWLGNTNVTDDGLKHLRGMTELCWLDLSGTRISDEGLTYLKEMKKLKQLMLRDTDVTKAGVESLRKALPSLDAVSFGNSQ